MCGRARFRAFVFGCRCGSCLSIILGVSAAAAAEVVVSSRILGCVSILRCASSSTELHLSFCKYKTIKFFLLL